MPRPSAVLVLVLLAVPASASASGFDDFRIPENRWRRTDVLAYGIADLASGHNGPGAGRGSLGSFQVSGGWQWGFDSDPSRRVLRLAVAGAGNRSHAESHRREDRSPTVGYPLLFQQENEGQGRGLRENLGASADLRWHPWRLPWGLAAGLVVQAGFGQDWTSSENRYFQRFDTEEYRYSSPSGQRSDRYDYVAAAQAAPGYGRVRNADGVFAARLLEERLIHEGHLSGPLGAAARERLARLFYLGSGYSRAHVLAGKFFWRDVEAALADDPAVRSARLDAYTLLRALEPVLVARTGFPRPVGWFAGPTVALVHRHSILRVERSSAFRAERNGTVVGEAYERSGTRETTFYDAVEVGLTAEAHRPLGLRRQLDARADLRCDAKGGGGDFTVSSQVEFRQMVAERWFTTLSGYHGRRVRERDGPAGEWQAAAQARLDYFLEDRWMIGLGVAHQQQHRSELAFTSVDALQRSTRFQLSVGYGQGRFEAPGLIEPLLPLN